MYDPQKVNPHLRAYHTLEAQGHDMSGHSLPEIKSVHDVGYLVRHNFADWRRYGEVYTDTLDNLTLFCYRAQAQYDNRWNAFERMSRGLIVNSNGDVVARPFDKFFAWSKESRTPSAIVSVTEKLDGSLGISYHHNGQLKIATKGAFLSEQAVWATNWLNGRAPLVLGKGKPLPPNITLMFEIIYPDNRVVVDYHGYAGLILIGARNTITEQHLGQHWLDVFADVNGLERPRRYEFWHEDDVLGAMKALGNNREGLVAEFADGQLFKFKGEEYTRLHKLVTNLTLKDVMRALRDGEVEDIRAQIPQTFAKFWQKFNSYADEVMAKVTAVQNNCFAAYHQAQPHANQKEFALWVKANHPDLQHYLFAMRSGKDIWPMIFDKEF